MLITKQRRNLDPPVARQRGNLDLSVRTHGCAKTNVAERFVDVSRNYWWTDGCTVRGRCVTTSQRKMEQCLIHRIRIRFHKSKSKNVPFKRVGGGRRGRKNDKAKCNIIIDRIYVNKRTSFRDTRFYQFLYLTHTLIYKCKYLFYRERYSINVIVRVAWKSRRVFSSSNMFFVFVSFPSLEYFIRKRQWNIRDSKII